MESDNGMKELLLSIAAISAKNRTIKAEPFSGKQEDYPKWRLKQKQLFISANMAHDLEPTFSVKLPSSKTMELDETTPAGKEFAKYRRQNAKAAAVLIAAQESEDVILAIQEANTMIVTWPSGTAPDMWKALEDIFNRMMGFLICRWRRISMRLSSPRKRNQSSWR